MDDFFDFSDELPLDDKQSLLIQAHLACAMTTFQTIQLSHEIAAWLGEQLPDDITVNNCAENLKYSQLITGWTKAIEGARHLYHEWQSTAGDTDGGDTRLKKIGRVIETNKQMMSLALDFLPADHELHRKAADLYVELAAPISAREFGINHRNKPEPMVYH